MTYSPRPFVAGVLNYALATIEALPYRPSSRYVFYRLVQEKGLSKGDYKNRFLKWTSRARKEFWGGWGPDTMVDDTRGSIHCEGEHTDVDGWLDDLKIPPLTLTSWQQEGIETIVLVAYEAKAMTEQFKHFCAPWRVTLFPFGGDPSIEYKWRIAGMIDQYLDAAGGMKPLVVLYFGDLDPKGCQIPMDALGDIEAWTEHEYSSDGSPGTWRFERVGLTLEQAHKLRIPEQFDRPGCYQWEAVEHEQAGRIIEEALAKHIDRDALDQIRAKEDTVNEMIEGLDDTLDLIRTRVKQALGVE